MKIRFRDSAAVDLLDYHFILSILGKNFYISFGNYIINFGVNIISGKGEIYSVRFNI
jgi:hypothetical protein